MSRYSEISTPQLEKRLATAKRSLEHILEEQSKRPSWGGNEVFLARRRVSQIEVELRSRAAQLPLFK